MEIKLNRITWNEEQKILFDHLKTAIEKVYSEKRMLFECEGKSRYGLEQAFVFRTGIYLYEILKNTEYCDLDLDSEYNKNFLKLKSSDKFPKGMKPDLILHERNTNNKNMIVVEFKGSWNGNYARDREKLIELTKSDSQYRYTMGVLVKIFDKKCKYEIYINGNKEIIN
ncbi:MAG: hypothetical protein IAE65_01120 [Ignavibacteria bacterium]|nr:hypothetical protein [Ignavibacteria bacterium]